MGSSRPRTPGTSSPHGDQVMPTSAESPLPGKLPASPTRACAQGWLTGYREGCAALRIDWPYQLEFGHVTELCGKARCRPDVGRKYAQPPGWGLALWPPLAQGGHLGEAAPVLNPGRTQPKQTTMSKESPGLHIQGTPPHPR